MAIGDYCTQVGPSGSGREACGAACLASCALSNGWQSDPWALTVEIATKYGIIDQGATSQQLIDAAADYGMDGRMWYGWEQALEALGNGEAVLCLNYNERLEPRPYPSGSGWNANHWIRLCAVVEDGRMCYVYDPLTYLYNSDGSVYQNPTVATQESVWAAIMGTGYPDAGVILTSRSGVRLNGLA